MSHSMEVKVDHWATLEKDALAIRYEVFVVEQQVPEELEKDEWDAQCWHAVAYRNDGVAVATGRLLPDGHIGRVAVIESMRGKGVGTQIMDALIEKAAGAGHKMLVLSSQVHARAFYERRGFVAEGDIYDDAGIDHILMRRHLA